MITYIIIYIINLQTSTIVEIIEEKPKYYVTIQSGVKTLIRK